MTKNNIAASITTGFWFQFHVDDLEISIRCSAVTGKESVYVNEALVSDKYSWKFNNSHHFVIKGKSYTVNVHLNARDWFRGLLNCSLFVDGDFIETKEKGVNGGTDMGTWRDVLLFCFFGGAVAGVCIGMLMGMD